MRDLPYLVLGLLLGCLFLMLAGCGTGPRYVDGSMVQLGAYVPVSGECVGIEVVNYLSGCAVRSSTNQPFTVKRSYCTTNDYFKLVTIREAIETEVSVGAGR